MKLLGHHEIQAEDLDCIHEADGVWDGTGVERYVVWCRGAGLYQRTQRRLLTHNKNTQEAIWKNLIQEKLQFLVI